MESFLLCALRLALCIMRQKETKSFLLLFSPCALCRYLGQPKAGSFGFGFFTERQNQNNIVATLPLNSLIYTNQFGSNERHGQEG